MWNTWKSVQLDKPLYLIGDLHIGASTTPRDVVTRLAELTKDGYTVLLGDVLEYGMLDDLRSLIRARLIEGPATKEEIREYVEYAVLSEMEKVFASLPNLLLVCEGNHDRRMNKLTALNFLRYLASKYDVLYVEGQGALRLETPTGTYWLIVTHGARGGRRLSAPTNELEDIAKTWENVDIIAIGHHHKLSYTAFQRYVLTDDGPKERTIHLVGVPALMGWEMYAQQKGYTPAVRGIVKLTFEPNVQFSFVRW